jgi:hypothetical protein
MPPVYRKPVSSPVSLAAKTEPRWKERALEQLEAALERGLPPARLKDKSLRPLEGERLQRLSERPAVSAPPTPPVQFLDPLEG